LNVAAEENLGMAMIYTLVSILKESLEDTLLSADSREKETLRLAEERERERLRADVETQIKSLRRTPVTFDLFMEWKGKFDKWKAEQKRLGNDVDNVRGRNMEKERREEWRLTGREVFERMKAEAGEGFEEGEEDGLVETQDSNDEDVENVTQKVGETQVNG
jgi:hypothetical protein